MPPENTSQVPPQNIEAEESVLGAMLSATEHARSQGKGVAVVLGDPPTETVARIFEVTGLAEVLPTRATREEAQEIFSRASAG